MTQSLDPVRPEEPKDPDAVVVRCIICSTPYTNKQIDSLRACLKCQSQAMPLPVNGDIEGVKVNWLELMILVEWAENYAHVIAQNTRNKTSVDVIGAIAKRLSVHRPEGLSALLVAERMMEQAKTGDQLRIIVTPSGIGGKLKLN